MTSFREWELAPEVLAALDADGITAPTPIQRLAIGPALDGYDVIAKAETGTGKTIAFGAPLMTRIDPSRRTVLALVMCPTRELAQQVAGVLESLGKGRGVKVAFVVGGEEMEPQILALRAGAQVIVGTPGRILDLHQRKLVSFPWTEFAVLDEADEMLEIGFLPDVEKILSRLPEERQTLLFSATFPPALLKLAREHTRNPVEVATASGVKTVDNIKQSWMRLADEDRVLALLRLIERSEDDDVFIVFCDRRTDVDVLFRRMSRAPFPVRALHGGFDQPARFRVMTAFRNREVKALIATDVASRGLDVTHVTHVINYSAPRDVSDYTHRIGRTGRAGRSGEAITFVTPHESTRWRRVLAGATWDIPEVDPPGRRTGPSPAPRAAAPARDRDVDRDARDVAVDRESRRPAAERSDRGARRNGAHDDEGPADAVRREERDDRRRREAPFRDDRPAAPSAEGPSRSSSRSASSAPDERPAQRRHAGADDRRNDREPAPPTNERRTDERDAPRAAHDGGARRAAKAGDADGAPSTPRRDPGARRDEPRKTSEPASHARVDDARHPPARVRRDDDDEEDVGRAEPREEADDGGASSSDGARKRRGRRGRRGRR
ncbi:MAG TPA: DEAD/DEAH box helicase [Planctomycetota bacterium]|nr:DEAD/DEAH box helicase [Planctomycetota bacterium]